MNCLFFSVGNLQFSVKSEYAFFSCSTFIPVMSCGIESIFGSGRSSDSMLSSSLFWKGSCVLLYAAASVANCSGGIVSYTKNMSANGFDTYSDSIASSCSCVNFSVNFPIFISPP